MEPPRDPRIFSTVRKLVHTQVGDYRDGNVCLSVRYLGGYSDALPREAPQLDMVTAVIWVNERIYELGRGEYCDICWVYVESSRPVEPKIWKQLVATAVPGG